MSELKPCKCKMFLPFAFSTDFLTIPVSHTVMCLNCGEKVRGRTFQKAVEKWNRRVGEGEKG